jgi:hypothetical protein
MKRITVISALIVVFIASVSFAMMHEGTGSGSSMMGDQEQQQPGQPAYGGCNPYGMMGRPGMMGYGMHPGMMGGGMMGMGQGMMGGMHGMMGSGMGQGMMGQGQGMMGYGMGQGMMGQGQGMMGYGDPEEYKKYADDYNKYLDDTKDLRRKFHNLKFEYSEALRDPKTKTKTLTKIEKEMRGIQNKMFDMSPRYR